jgi:hypothetical protein
MSGQSVQYPEATYYWDERADVSFNPDTEWCDYSAPSCVGRSHGTTIKVEPLPDGMTDIDILEAGWVFVDQKKVIVYGAINGADSNGNGILDSEEGIDENKDFDGRRSKHRWGRPGRRHHRRSRRNYNRSCRVFL